MNKVFLIGNISTDIQLRYTQSNMAVATFNLAINRLKRGDGTQVADFINIVVWGKQAESINKYLNKGSKLAIDGRIQTRNYNAQDGAKRYVTEVVAENVQFLDSKKTEQVSNQVSEQVTTKNNVAQQADPFEEFGKQVAINDYPNMYDDDLPF